MVQIMAGGFTKADKIMSGMETRVVSQGRLAGETFEVLEWQQRVVYDFVNHKILGVSMARGNGKTTFFAALVCEVMDGVLTVKRGEVDFAAASIAQARILFRHVKHLFGEERLDTEQTVRKVKVKQPDGTEKTKVVSRKKRWRVIDNQQGAQITDRDTGTEIIGCGSDADVAHGLAPSLVLMDEPAKWKKGGRRLFNALRGGMGKQPDARSVALGTLPEDPDHWFSNLMAGANPNAAIHLYAAEGDDPDFEEEIYRKANPSYDHLHDLREIIHAEAEDAQMGGEELGHFRAYRLNKGTPEVTDKKPIVTVEDWRAVTRRGAAPKDGPVAVGVDLGGGTSMSAVSFYWPDTGRLECVAALPAQPSLEEKGKMDGVGNRYCIMATRGELLTYPGKATNNVLFLQEAFERIEGHVILEISADEFRKKDLEQALLEAALMITVQWRRVGTGADGSYDVRAFQQEVMTGWIRADPSVLMESAIRESMLRWNENNNVALSKARHKGRNDALQAAVLASGIGRRYRKPSEPPPGDAKISDFIVTPGMDPHKKWQSA